MYSINNSKHFPNIRSVSITKKILSPNYFFVCGADWNGALARRQKGGRPAGRRLKIASIGSAAAGAAPVRCAIVYLLVTQLP